MSFTGLLPAQGGVSFFPTQTHKRKHKKITVHVEAMGSPIGLFADVVPPLVVQV
jgi:hypothetical protein